MRGSDHDKELKEYEIGQSGIRMLQSINGYEGIMSGTPKKMSLESASNSFAKTFSGARRKTSS
jgi:hypothetical protein